MERTRSAQGHRTDRQLSMGGEEAARPARSGWTMRSTGLKIIVAGLVLANTGVVIAGEPSGRSDRPGWVDARDTAVAAPPPWVESSSTPLSTSTPAALVKPDFPAAASWNVRLGGSGQTAQETSGGAGKRPVVVAARGEKAAGQTVRVEVLDRASAARLGASGFAFALSPAVDATLTVDYSGFADAFGAGYADRLAVLALPRCALADPAPAGCDARDQRLPVRK